jgi:hypothetical protein
MASVVSAFLSAWGLNMSSAIAPIPRNGAGPTRAFPIWKTWAGGVILLLGAAMTPVWLGLLTWLGYEVALAAAGVPG